MNTCILTASHYGVVRFGDLQCEAVVLNGGERGYVRRQLMKLLGFAERQRGDRFAGFLREIAPNSLSLLNKQEATILLPSGQKAQFFPSGIIADVASAVVNAAIDGTLHKARRGIVPNCMKIMRSLAVTGEVALIDEATGYQYHRAPDALQALISRLLRERVASWERRFSPDYYRALFRLFGWHYQGHQQNPPAVIGQITLRWVYDVIMPREIIEEIRNRKRLSDKAHQWLSEGGLALLEKQIHAVTMIARSSMTYRDFDTRCATAFGSQPLQMTLFIGALEGGQ